MFPPRRIPPLGPPRLTPAQRVRAQWRRVDLSPLEKSLARPARPLAALLPSVLKGLRMDSRRTEAEILKVWNSSLPPDLIAHAQPTGYHKGTVFISVDSSPWMCEIIRYRRKEILERLRHSFGHEFISKLSFRIG